MILGRPVLVAIGHNIAGSNVTSVVIWELRRGHAAGGRLSAWNTLLPLYFHCIQARGIDNPFLWLAITLGEV